MWYIRGINIFVEYIYREVSTNQHKHESYLFYLYDYIYNLNLGQVKWEK